MATTSSSNLVSGPSALYWRTTIRVAAGAVAAAMEPSVMAEDTEIKSGLMKWVAIRAASTSSVVNTAWTIPTVMACPPICRSCSSRNSFPMVKAIKPRATWEMMSRLVTSSGVLKPISRMFSAPIQ